MVDERAHQGAAQHGSGAKEISQKNSNDRACVPSTKHGLQQLFHRCVTLARPPGYHEGGRVIGRDLEEVAQAKEEVSHGHHNKGHSVERGHGD